ncbi:MAG: DUF861 domain-containing protein [Alphaproteobacteria bacterium]|nr:DUF861 domain-containing protein [Alphaproteobacteria bacterium]
MTASPMTIGLIAAATAIPSNDLADWGAVEKPLGTPVSTTRGRILDRGQGGFPESGVWECSPGTWRCEVGRAEFCHFLSGRCIYTHDNGEIITIESGMTAWFPAGWAGRCQVTATVRKVYAIV